MNFEEKIRNFNELVNAINDEDIAGEIFLPIFHAPKIGDLPLVLQDEKLQPKDGNPQHEDEALIFFYYGSSQFIPKEDAVYGSSLSAPITFAFDLDILEQLPIRIYPFDSGGYDKYGIPPSYKIQAFQIKNPKKEDVKKIVFALYKGYKNYLKKKHEFKKLVHGCILCPQLKELDLLYDKTDVGRSDVDIRAKTVEIHYEEQILLKPMWVIYPLSIKANQEDAETAIKQLKSQFPDSRFFAYEVDSNEITNRESINNIIKEILK